MLLADWAWSGAPLADLRAAAGAAGEDLLRGASLGGAVSGHGRLEGAPASLRASGIMRFEGLDARGGTGGTGGPETRNRGARHRAARN